jgi:hypothetical protein
MKRILPWRRSQRMVLANTAFGLMHGLASGSARAHGQQAADASKDVPVLDGGAGPCSADFIVTDAKGAPVYDARIRVHIAYRFLGAHRLDLEVSTNSDGKARFKGLPEKIRGGPVYFQASKNTADGTAWFDPVKSCNAQPETIVLKDR